MMETDVPAQAVKDRRMDKIMRVLFWGGMLMSFGGFGILYLCDKYKLGVSKDIQLYLQAITISGVPVLIAYKVANAVVSSRRAYRRRLAKK